MPRPREPEDVTDLCAWLKVNVETWSLRFGTLTVTNPPDAAVMELGGQGWTVLDDETRGSGWAPHRTVRLRRKASGPQE